NATTLLQCALLAFGALMLSACDDGGGGSGSGNGSGAGGTPKSCQEAFSVDAAAAGQDCTPQADKVCEVKPNQVLNSTPVPCDGVIASDYTVSGTPYEYLAIGPAGGHYTAVVLALHYLGADTGKFSNVARLSELAKARNVLVIAPQATGLVQ